MTDRLDKDCTAVGFSGEGRCIEPAVKDGLCSIHAAMTYDDPEESP